MGRSEVSLAFFSLALAACGGATELAKTEPPAPPPKEAPAAVASAKEAPAEPVAATPDPTPPPAPEPPPPPPSRCPKGMVEVAGGAFKAGKAKESVEVATFCLDVNETTAAEYAGCVQSGGCDTNRLTVCDGTTYGKPDLADHPMVCIDFPQAEAYCKAQNKRLPSTYEWEWAARAGDEGRVFPWGNEEPGDQFCWGGKSGLRASTCAIGSFPQSDSPLGLKDLGGSVYEWTTSPSDKTSTIRHGHGGSWKDSARDLFRNDRSFIFKTTYRCGFLGIRCATEPAPAP